MAGSQSPLKGQREHLSCEAVDLDALLGLSLYGARVVSDGPCCGPRLQSAGRQAGCEQDDICGQLVHFPLGPKAHSPFKEKGSAIFLALGVNGLV